MPAKFHFQIFVINQSFEYYQLPEQGYVQAGGKVKENPSGFLSRLPNNQTT
jgi:hypothetical protein